MSLVRRLVPLCLLLASTTVAGQQASTTVTRNNPTREPFTDALLSRLRVPEGFHVSVYARDLTDPRMMRVASDGTVYVTRWHTGDVVALRDTDGDGVADITHILGQLPGAHGLELAEPYLAVASPTEVWVTTVAADRVLTPALRLIADLPDGGQHPNRVVRLGPDGLIYVSVGSSCNDCAEENQVERGAILRFAVDGSRVDVLAKGLRNTIGFDWHPTTGALWGMDHGNDFHGDDTPPEELNRIEAGKHYGWPNCYANRIVDAMTNAPPERQALQPGEPRPLNVPIPPQEFCDATEPSVLTYDAHTAPIDLVFYRHAQFAGYQGDAFISFHGSWNRAMPVGYKVVRLRFEAGHPVGFEDFLSGFLSDDGTSYFGRPAGLAVGPDGSLYVSDDGNGVIYRISSRPSAPVQSGRPHR